MPPGRSCIERERDLQKYVGDYALFMSGLFRSHVSRGGYLDYYLEQFKRNVEAHGGKVVYCKDAMNGLDTLNRLMDPDARRARCARRARTAGRSSSVPAPGSRGRRPPPPGGPGPGRGRTR